MDLKKVIFRLKNIDFGAKFGKNYKSGLKNHYFRIIKMGHVSEASVAHPHPYQNISPRVPTQMQYHSCLHLDIKKATS